MDRVPLFLYDEIDKRHQKEGEILSVKSITEILGGAQIVFDISFDLQDIFLKNILPNNTERF